MKSSLKLLKAKKRPPRKHEESAANAVSRNDENADEAVARLYALLDEASKASRTAIKKEAEEKKAEERFKYAQQHKAITKLPATKAKMWNQILELRDEHTVLKKENFRMSETIERQERELRDAEERIASDASTLAELRNELKELGQLLMDTRRNAETERREANARLKEASERAKDELRALAEEKDAELAELRQVMGAECERLQKSIAELEAENADWKRRHAKYRDMHADAELRLLEAKRGVKYKGEFFFQADKGVDVEQNKRLYG